MNNSLQQLKTSFPKKVYAYLELMRPANIITAFADILAGFSATGGVLFFDKGVPFLAPSGVGWLLLSTFGLYGGGVVFNDIFDARLDAEERPERALQSGRASLKGAIILGGLLFFIGVYSAFQVGLYSGIIAISIMFCALLYDFRAKSSSFGGPLVMGLCRGGNFLLGCSIFPLLLPQVWFIAIIPITYIASITLISKGEVHGGGKKSGIGALILVLMINCSLVLLSFIPDYQMLPAILFVLLFGSAVIPPFYRAAFKPKAPLIKKAVERGVLSLIILNSAISAGFGGILLGILVVLLLPVSIGISKLFAVT